MGAVRCTIHGHQIGEPMACRHLSADVWGGVTTRPFQEFRGDFFDDGTVLLNVALCTDCVARFCVSARVAVDSRILESADPVPLCPECWRKLSRQCSGPSDGV
jgi:hypothetical protein